MKEAWRGWALRARRAHGSRGLRNRKSGAGVASVTAGLTSGRNSGRILQNLQPAGSPLMNIAFLKPPIGGILGLEMLTFVEPLGPISIAGGLEADGHTVKILDLRIEGEEQGMELCRSFAPEVIGLQCNFTTERFRTLRLAERVRREMPEAFIVVGGHDASRDPSWFCHPAIDAVAVGDGEEIMSPLVEALEKRSSLEKVPGLVLNRDGGQRA